MKNFCSQCCKAIPDDKRREHLISVHNIKKFYPGLYDQFYVDLEHQYSDQSA